jgi:hypothetical protein
MDGNMTAVHDPNVTTLSDDQERLLSVLGVISGTLSLLGGGLIVARVWRLHRANTTTPYDRMMGALSIFDIMSSFSFGFGSLLLPKETSPRVWASGNEMTCNMLGFLTQLSFCSVWCVASESIDGAC